MWQSKKATSVAFSLVCLLLLSGCGQSDNISLPTQITETITPQDFFPTSTVAPANTATPVIVQSFLGANPVTENEALITDANFFGLDRGRYLRFDLGLAVGENKILLTSTDEIALKDRLGRELTTSYTRDFFNSVLLPQGENVANSRVFYDNRSNRFFIVATAKCIDIEQGHNNYLGNPNCTEIAVILAVSSSKDPQGLSTEDWFFYRFDAKDVQTEDNLPELPEFAIADYTSITVTKDFILIAYAINEAPDNANLYQFFRIIDKHRAIQGQEIDSWTDLVTPWFSLPAISREFNNTVYLSGFHISQQPCSIEIGKFEIETLEISRRTIRLSSCELAPRGRQIDGPYVGFEGGVRERPYLVDDSLFLTGTVGTEYSGTIHPSLKIVEIDIKDWNNPLLIQDINLSTESIGYYLPVIAVTDNKDLVAVFSCSGEDMWVSICSSGRISTDPPGTMRPVSVLISGVNTVDWGLPERDVENENSNPWGDFPSAWIEVDNSAVWVTAAMPNGDSWFSCVFRIRFTETENSNGNGSEENNICNVNLGSLNYPAYVEPTPTPTNVEHYYLYGLLKSISGQSLAGYYIQACSTRNVCYSSRIENSTFSIKVRSGDYYLAIYHDDTYLKGPEGWYSPSGLTSEPDPSGLISITNEDVEGIVVEIP